MGELRREIFDIVIIGAGPAGMAAAATACAAGAHAALVDDNGYAGGQIWRRANNARHGKSVLATRWINHLQRSAAGSGGLARLQQTRVVGMPRANVLLAESERGALEIHYDKLILATGARELFLPFPGWTHPRVMGAGGLQSLVKSGLPIVGRRVIVAGSGPLLLAVANYLRHAGAIVPLIAEQAHSAEILRFAAGLARTPAKLLQAALLRGGLIGTRYCADAWPLRAQESGGRLSVTLQIGKRRRVETADYLACGFGLVANVELAALAGCKFARPGCVAVDDCQETSVKHVFAAGELTGIGGVEKAIVEGQIAGLAAAGRTTQTARLFGNRDAALAFTARLEKAFTLRPELKTLAGPDEIICRCEDVTLGQLTIGDGDQTFHSLHDAKLHTRCGMGPCQGRICGPAVAFITGAENDLRIRPPILPARVATLAADGGA